MLPCFTTTRRPCVLRADSCTAVLNVKPCHSTPDGRTCPLLHWPPAWLLRECQCPCSCQGQVAGCTSCNPSFWLMLPHSIQQPCSWPCSGACHHTPICACLVRGLLQCMIAAVHSCIFMPTRHFRNTSVLAGKRMCMCRRCLSSPALRDARSLGVATAPHSA